LRDRDLVRLYWPADLRGAFDALFAIDDAMADVVAKATEPTLAAIKLAWWRERLEELDAGRVSAEPRLRAAATELLPRSITGAELASLEEGFAALLQPGPNPEVVLQRGARLFSLAGRLLGVAPAMELETTGRLYAAGQLNRIGNAPTGTFAITEMRAIPSRLRRLTGLAVLARRDLRRREAEATPGRAFALLRHRLTGRIS
jgi:phytoene synthase